MTDDYERHLRERRNQRYRSTRLWAADPHELGMIGEKCLAKYFGVPQDFRNRPGGDHGIDLQIRMWDEWFSIDAKATTYGDYLRCPQNEVKRKTIYVLVFVTNLKRREGNCYGWLWGQTLMWTPARAWFRGDIVCHRWEADKLRDMQDLKDQMTDWRHEGGKT